MVYHKIKIWYYAIDDYGIGGIIMMRTIKRITACLMSFTMLCTLVLFMPDCAMVTEAAANDNKRACWISYLDFETYLKDLSESEFRNKVSEMYDKIKNNSMDTVIVHARAMGDAMYPSKYYPWSFYVTSSGGSPGYDPIAIMVEIAHSKGLKFEAWINPYRLSLDNKTTERFKATSYYNKYKNYIIEYKNANNNETALALDPAKPQSRELIVNGVKEIVSKYDVDGIHFDDYFYVSGMKDSLDTASRMNNVNTLVRDVYSAVKSIDKDCVFGISPAGNTSNARAQGADIDRWMSEAGYVDYIMPQIYWTDNYKTSSGMTKMYSERCSEWASLNKRDIPIYVGLALYRAGEVSSYDLGWSASSSNLADQYKIAMGKGYDGYALFRYAWLENSKAATELANLKVYVDTLNGKYSYNPDSYISYATHVQTFGWQTAKSDGILSGTTGLGKRLEAISISLGDKAGEGGVMYRTHCQSYGWLDWVSNGKLSGTHGQSKRLEAIQIKLTGKAAKTYDVYYRVHCQSYGWLDWAKNGEPAGSATYGKRLEAIQIKLVKKGSAAPGQTAVPYATRNIKYNTHIQTYGSLDYSYDGETSGTVGQAKRLESIRISIADTLIEGGISYRTHCQTYGWLPWVSDGAMSGTEGQAKRLEAIEIKLTGKAAEQYDVYYRVHCQSYGWLDWVKNGETAGTFGQAKRLEAIEIKLVPKGKNP